MDLDIVTVVHNDVNTKQAALLESDLQLTASAAYTYTIVDNSLINRGYGPGCNFGAQDGTAPIIGFLNPDVILDGPFMSSVIRVLQPEDVVIAGENFNKPIREYRSWGCDAWVCGAAFFVKRPWFESIGGFDENYKWGWEETHMIRQAQIEGMRVVSCNLPIRHSSPTENSPTDTDYKRHHFDAGARYFRKTWS